MGQAPNASNGNSCGGQASCTAWNVLGVCVLAAWYREWSECVVVNEQRWRVSMPSQSALLELGAWLPVPPGAWPEGHCSTLY